MANVLCKYCSMPVGALTPACPRCRRNWPGMRPRTLRRATVRALVLVAVGALVALLWTPLLAG